MEMGRQQKQEQSGWKALLYKYQTTNPLCQQVHIIGATCFVELHQTEPVEGLVVVPRFAATYLYP